MIPSPSLVREAVRELAPYQPGKPIADVAREMGVQNIVKMASNENPLGPSPRALAAIRRNLGALHLYPDGAGLALKEKLAEKFGLDEACFTLGNGSSDILTFVLWAFVNAGDEVLTSRTTFLMYSIFAKISHAKFVEVPLREWRLDLEAMAARITSKTKVIVLCNPNNPTGTIFGAAPFRRFMKSVPDHVIVVLDEAYAEFVEDKDFPDSVGEVRRGRNVVVMRTFSKIVGLAGLRIGFGISNPQIADWLNRVRPPFNTNTLAQAAAVAALDDAAHMRKTRRMIIAGRKFFARQFDAMGLTHVPSWTNFVVVRVAPLGGEEVFRRLMAKGIIVRSMDAYGLKDYMRVTVGTMAQNKRFIQALKKILG